MRPSIAGAWLVLLVGGCSMGPLPIPPASIKTVSAIDAAHLMPLAVGSFTADPAVRSHDASMAIRGGIIKPEDGSFARYLGATLERQLTAAGRLDSAAPAVISGRLTENEVGSAIGADAGHALLGAEFALTVCGREHFRKHLEVRRNWNSSFIGAVAIPIAEQGYASLYTALAEELLTDPEFIAAAAAPADGKAPACG